ncbi:hypothetical protein EZV62_001915 [Acer yangbiense]|uniref:hAT-like transposase RNase-H fold domain-containing protein n=1 Tax=Acer yangbiense TaxID=1000413 RepID=A0A5C7IY09_9ROSI|nr:hypothetical protein EZV62_001915 [Acer yangbiense]
MNPRFDVASRRTIVRDLYKLYVEERIKLKKYFKSSQGDSIGRCIEKVLLEWGIDKIFIITVDNATTNANAISYMNRKLISWHVDGAILEVGDNGFVVLDVPTRWNSTYLMLESAVKLRKAFKRMEEEDGNYVSYFWEKESEKKRIGPPLFNDWENAKGGLDKTNNLLIIAVVLDPKYKLAYVKWRFDVFFGVQQAHLMISSLKEVLVDLYECYVKLYGGVGVKSNDGVSSFGSGVSETFCEKEKFSEGNLWGQKQQEEDVSLGKSEVELYLLEACEKLNDKFDLLAW